MSVKHILLGILSWRPSSGYDIKLEVEVQGRQMGWGSISYGSIYPQLKKLEEKGLIQAQYTEKSGRKTTIYDLTGKGWTELSNWLAQPPSYPTTRDELYMKLSFWETAMPEDRHTLIQHLELRRQESLALLEHFQQWINNDRSAISEMGKIAMEYDQARLRLDIEWSDRIIEQLKQPAQPPHQDPNRLFEKARHRRKCALQQDGYKKRNGDQPQ
ncbi:PadR family transcriptional regulator [Kroppenstedtia pulmonis]|uniref:PadR family transcriptional regulator n=1 Tax=Kroppenstedtia pulmonis TaxID=1380685 RepID=A0A7D4CH39_9BACL|nr:helix-turn-helix transcriptional regulator [Kroppenstedtia pulmonis]QKG85254.1 PadR family transcriptional regulator [Kroppenstedtia pulmonis]